jgi:hypothetical protein
VATALQAAQAQLASARMRLEGFQRAEEEDLAKQVGHKKKAGGRPANEKIDILENYPLADFVHDQQIWGSCFVHAMIACLEISWWVTNKRRASAATLFSVAQAIKIRFYTSV